MKQIALIALIAVGSGCFTTIGTVAGAASKKHTVVNGQTVEDGNYAGTGFVVGALLDALVIYALVSTVNDLKTSCYTPCGD